MNAHQRRKARRRYGHFLQLAKVPYPLLEMAADVPGGLEQAEELCRSVGLSPSLWTFKVDLDGTWEVVPPREAELRWAIGEDVKPIALDYFAWRRRRYESGGEL